MFDFVCGMELEGETEFRVASAGRDYFFCSTHCRDEFAADVETFLKTEPIIALEGVHKTYELGSGGAVPVLRGLSMRVYPGDLVALVGPSGSGKSTAMNIIGTLDTPTSGRVRVLGKDISGLSETALSDLRSKDIGFVFQQFNLIPSLTAIENVMLPRMIRGQAGPETKKRASELLASVGLAARSGHRPMQMSGGEQQRVAIARAFMNDPPIILADEPTGNLDSSTSGKIIDLLVDLWQKHRKTIIIVTHDPHVASHAMRVLSFEDGRLMRNHGLAEKSIWSRRGHDKAGV
ncbi:MAG: ATP-binding cassette domain-containing protein [Patescibacteria group bacterium]